MGKEMTPEDLANSETPHIYRFMAFGHGSFKVDGRGSD
jgi:hypothetical protein